MERQYFKTCGGGVSVTPGPRKAAAGEAVASDCLKVDSTSITFTAGRKGSATTAGVFMEGFNDTTVYGIYGGGCLAGPASLDSALEVSRDALPCVAQVTLTS